jgi:hypothetical protein
MMPFSGIHHYISDHFFPVKKGISRLKTVYLIKLIGHIHKKNFKNSYLWAMPRPWWCPVPGPRSCRAVAIIIFRNGTRQPDNPSYPELPGLPFRL